MLLEQVPSHRLELLLLALLTKCYRWFLEEEEKQCWLLLLLLLSLEGVAPLDFSRNSVLAVAAAVAVSRMAPPRPGFF